MKEVTKENMELWNKKHVMQHSGKAKKRWGGLNGSLRNRVDRTMIVSRLWYGPYGWGITGKEVK